MSATEDQIKVRKTGAISTITLNRARQFNALSATMLADFQIALDKIASDRTTRVVVIDAAGAAFCAGHDLKEMLANRSELFISHLFEQCCGVMLTLTNMPQPTIAKVQGIATAAGCQLVASCDLAVAADDSRFATSGINYGLFCATPGVAVSRVISRKHALEMLLTGDFVDASTALAWGLINRVTSREELDGEVDSLARRLAEKPAAILAKGKRFFYQQVDMPPDRAYRLAAEVITRNMLDDHALEGVSAFVEKRRPNWDGDRDR